MGALFNATTWFDRTNYFEILPSEYLELAIQIEADRMRNSLIRDEDRQSEMTVVRNEFDIGENHPERVLHDRLFAHAYIAHPYHHSTIGWRSDIEGVSTDRLKEFYDTFYWPNNATVSVIGYFDEYHVLELIKKYFGVFDRSPHPIPEIYTQEPPQQGEVRFKIQRAGQLGLVAIAHKTPEALHPDIPALDLLAAVLSMGKTSCLYREIVDKNLGISQYTHAYQLRDPSLIVTQVTLTPNTSHEKVERLILENYARIQNEGVSEQQLRIARNQLIADIAYDRDGTYAYASKLNEAIASANWEHYVTYIDKLKSVTPADIQRVAQRYLVEENRVVGYFIPGQEASGSVSRVSDTVPGPAHYSAIPPAGTCAAVGPAASPGPRYTDRVQTVTLSNGGTVLLLETGVENVISLRGSIPAGDFFSPPEKKMVAKLTANLLDHGTKKRDKFKLAEALEEMGAELRFTAGTFDLTIKARFLTEHTERVLELVREILQEPAFTKTEFELVKQQLLAMLRKKMESTASQAHNLLMRQLFTPGHPYYNLPFEELIQQTEQIQLEDVEQFYREHYGGSHFIVSLAGDLQNTTLDRKIEALFGSWKGGKPVPAISPVQLGQHSEQHYPMKDKPNIDVYFGHGGMPRLSDSDYLAFYIGNHILGDNPLSSRLGVTIRDTMGLSYSISSFVSTSNLADGYFGIYMAVSPPDLARAKEAVFDLVRRYLEEGPSEKEVEDARRNIIGKFKVVNGLNSGALAGQLHYVQREGLGVHYMDEFEDRVASVSVDHVKEALRTYLHPERLAVAMAGGLEHPAPPSSE